MNEQHPTQRFSSRVEDYVKYRPSYPEAVVAFLEGEGFLKPGAVVADVGSGTGLLAELFLRRGRRVIGIEPNEAMRMAGDRYLRDFSQFTSAAGTAEATTLPDASVDLVAAGQAFHWFDQAAAKKEFRRILRRGVDSAGGAVCLVWNDRLVEASPFLVAYEDLLKEFSLDYTKVDHRQITDAVIAAFFRPAPVIMRLFENRQVFDFEGVRGRLLSSSYAPGPGHPRHEAMLVRLREIFDRHQREGRVAFEYHTKVYAGRLTQ